MQQFKITKVFITDSEMDVRTSMVWAPTLEVATEIAAAFTCADSVTVELVQ